MEDIDNISEIKRFLLTLFLYPLYFCFRYGLGISSLATTKEIRQRLR